MITNVQKGGIALALAILSDNIKLTRYNFPACKNNSIYTFNGEDLSFTIDFSKENNYDEVFRSILHSLLSERQINYIPTITDLEDEKLALKKVTDVTNSFLKEDKQVIVDKAEKLATFISDSSWLNEEYVVNDYAIATIASTILDKNENSKLKIDELMNILTQAEMDRIARLTSFFSLLNLDYTLQKPFDGDISVIDKDIIRFLTLCRINKKIRMTISMNGKIDNVIDISIQIPKKSPKLFKFYIHDKQSIAEDFYNLREKVYNSLISEEDKNLSIEEKERLIFEDIKETGIKPLSLTTSNSYIDSIQNGKINYGRDQSILGAILLNVASLDGGFGVVEDLSDTNSLSYDIIKDAFDNNYDNLIKCPSLGIRLSQQIQDEFGRSK